MEKDKYGNTNKKKARVAVFQLELSSEQRKLSAIKKVITIMTKESIFQEDTIILNVYGPNSGASKYVKHNLIELQEEIDKSTIIAGDFNTSLSVSKRPTRQKLVKHS